MKQFLNNTTAFTIATGVLLGIAGCSSAFVPFTGVIHTAADAANTAPHSDAELSPDNRPSAWESEFRPVQHKENTLTPDVASAAPEQQTVVRHEQRLPEITMTAAETSQPDTSAAQVPPASAANDAADNFAAWAEQQHQVQARPVTTTHAAIPRMPTSQPGCPVPVDTTIAASRLVEAYPDEYIFDGGDRDHPVHYYGGAMEGLDTEDTVAEFRDHEGDNHVKPTNRVAVYAPRFGSVETVSGPQMDVKVDHAVGARLSSGAIALEELRGPEINTSDDGAIGLDARHSASGLETAQAAQRSTRAQSFIEVLKVDQGMEAKSSSSPGLLQTSDQVVLNVRIDEPSVSKSSTGYGLAASTSQATVTWSTFRVQSVVGIDPRARKGELHIVKDADPLVAVPGDLITFSIRFKNTGDHSLHDVRIIDNLTPRLEYVNGSGEISVSGDAGGVLTVTPNKEGSQMLIFELDEPLSGGRSGVITFRARVR